MSLLERIPALSDDEVVAFLANARRLADEGDDKQQKAAEELLPVLEEEAETRRQARLEVSKAKRAASRKASTTRAA